MPSESVTVAVTTTESLTTPYVIKHYLKALGGSGYAVYKEEHLFGKTNAPVEATALGESGITEETNAPQRAASGNISADGSLELRLYYSRNSYTVTTKPGSAGLTSGR